MKLVVFILKAWILFAIILIGLCWPAVVLHGSEGVAAMLAWIMFLFINSAFIAIYIDMRGRRD